MLPFPVLLADIGGTYARFAILPRPDAHPTPIWKVTTAVFPGPVEAIRSYLDRPGMVMPRAACLAVAGRVGSGVTRLTNAPWRFDLAEIGLALGFDALRLINDYVPLAAALTILDPADPADLLRIGPPAAGTGTRLVIGPGTGLGAAALITAGERYLIQTTEAGHIGFGPCEPDDGLPWHRLMPLEGRLTAETLLSGPGLVRIARALAAARDAEVCWRLPAEILDGRAGNAVARETVEQFTRLLGRFAGDLSLMFGATGGVFLAGGIAPRIIADLQGDAFHAAFEDKPPFQEGMCAVPRFVITRPEPAIDGLAALLADEDGFLFPGQDWRRVEADQGRASTPAAP
ncbi:glucokinase [Methylobacterium sp. WCS2018Hpa-22]|uniref:glucokinase n=1 Tax=Methylobacterium sp. WCS2018Hpa-22 TaxID=3073633 RepID=UPI00288AED49|nr:glucokinase [Methylobacterium sp. WCS2018Hpa-22]